MLKNKLLLSVGIFVFVFAFFSFVGVSNVHAANTCTAATGNWSDTGTWSGCGGVVPTSADSVIIPAGVTVTITSANDLSTPAVAASVTLQDPVNASNAITLNSGSYLVITGALTFAGSSGTGNSTITDTLASINTGSLAMNGGSGGNSVLTSNSILTVNGNITFTGTLAKAQLTTTSNGYITMNGGTLSAGGTVSMSATSGFFTTGTSAVNGAYTFGNMEPTSGTLTLGASTSLAGNLTIDSGATVANSTYTVGIGGNLADSGTLTAGTGVYTLSGTTKTITGTVSIPSLAVTGTYTNNGTLTVTTALSGSGALTNGAGATLNIGGTSAMGTFTATATGNTVNYNAAGSQTVLAVPYFNLTLSGSGLKTVATPTFTGVFTVVMGGHNYTVSSGSTVTSINIGGSTIAEISASGTFTLTSPNGYPLNNVDGGAVVAPQTCTASMFNNYSDNHWYRFNIYYYSRYDTDLLCYWRRWRTTKYGWRFRFFYHNNHDYYDHNHPNHDSSYHNPNSTPVITVTPSGSVPGCSSNTGLVLLQVNHVLVVFL